MPDPIEKIFNVENLRKTWGNTYWVEPPPELPRTLELIQSLKQMIPNELGIQGKLFQPFLERLESLVREEDLKKNQAALKETLDQIEDMLDVFLFTK